MNILKRYIPEISEKQLALFGEMAELYRYWNERVNLISRKDMEALEEHHFLHSLAIAKAFRFPANSKVIDVGTGGGFPGIPLAVMFPQTRFILMDSIGKKINVVQEVAKSLNLQNVETLRARSNEYKEQTFDYIVSRAVSTLPKFYTQTKHLLNKKSIYPQTGIYYLKGGDFSDEIKIFHETKIFSIRKYFVEDYFQRKYVIYIHPNRK